MKLTIKIAAGVFIGIMGVLVVLAIPKWREHSRATDAERQWELLTPEKVIALCGKPSRDNSDRRGRYLEYDAPMATQPDDEHPVTVSVNFMMDSESHRLIFDNMWMGLKGATNFGESVNSHDKQLTLLPCLAAK